MPWFKVDDSFESHPKVKSIPKTKGHRIKAIGLWTLAGSWSASQLTDGFVPTYMLSELGGSHVEAKYLVSAGLWLVEDDGFRFKDWHDWQPTKAKVEADRDAAKERMRQARERKKGSSSGDVRTNNSEHGEGVRNRSTPRSSVTPTRPDPTRPEPLEEHELASASSAIVADAPSPAPSSQLALVGQAVNAGTLVGEWIEHCPQRPPGRVVGQVSKELKSLLDEGIDPDRIRRALAEWNRKGLHPSTLPSVVHEIANRAPAAKGQQATNDLFDAAMERALEKDRTA